MKENNIQKAVRQRDEILNIITRCFLEHVLDEDNSWRVMHNLLKLQLQLEPKLLNYFK